MNGQVLMVAISLYTLGFTSKHINIIEKTNEILRVQEFFEHNTDALDIAIEILTTSKEDMRIKIERFMQYIENDKSAMKKLVTSPKSAKGITIAILNVEDYLAGKEIVTQGKVRKIIELDNIRNLNALDKVDFGSIKPNNGIIQKINELEKEDIVIELAKAYEIIRRLREMGTNEKSDCS